MMQTKLKYQAQSEAYVLYVSQDYDDGGGICMRDGRQKRRWQRWLIMMQPTCVFYVFGTKTERVRNGHVGEFSYWRRILGVHPYYMLHSVISNVLRWVWKLNLKRLSYFVFIIFQLTHSWNWKRDIYLRKSRIYYHPEDPLQGFNINRLRSKSHYPVI